MVDLSKIAIGLLAGATGGLAAGFGARVAMRVIALLGGQPPGFTLEGTLFILILGAAMGAVMGLPFMAIRRILPGAGRSVLQKGLMFGLLVFLVFMVIPFLVFLARGELEAEGEFALVSPLGILGLFAPLPFVYGIVAEALMIWLERRTLSITPDARPASSGSSSSARSCFSAQLILLPVGSSVRGYWLWGG